MPNIKSAAKRLKQNVKCRLINRMRKSRVKTAEAHLQDSIVAANKEEAQKLLAKCFSELDKAAKKGVIHQNKADRKKARLFARVAKMA